MWWPLEGLKLTKAGIPLRQICVKILSKIVQCKPSCTEWVRVAVFPSEIFFFLSKVTHMENTLLHIVYDLKEVSQLFRNILRLKYSNCDRMYLKKSPVLMTPKQIMCIYLVICDTEGYEREKVNCNVLYIG